MSRTTRLSSTLTNTRTLGAIYARSAEPSFNEAVVHSRRSVCTFGAARGMADLMHFSGPVLVAVPLVPLRPPGLLRQCGPVTVVRHAERSTQPTPAVPTAKPHKQTPTCT